MLAAALAANAANAQGKFFDYTRKVCIKIKKVLDPLRV
jgi:hypothetical protein